MKPQRWITVGLAALAVLLLALPSIASAGNAEEIVHLEKDVAELTTQIAETEAETAELEAEAESLEAMSVTTAARRTAALAELKTLIDEVNGLEVELVQVGLLARHYADAFRITTSLKPGETVDGLMDSRKRPLGPCQFTRMGRHPELLVTSGNGPARASLYWLPETVESRFTLPPAYSVELDLVTAMTFRFRPDSIEANPMGRLKGLFGPESQFERERDLLQRRPYDRPIRLMTTETGKIASWCKQHFYEYYSWLENSVDPIYKGKEDELPEDQKIKLKERRLQALRTAVSRLSPDMKRLLEARKSSWEDYLSGRTSG